MMSPGPQPTLTASSPGAGGWLPPARVNLECLDPAEGTVMPPAEPLPVWAEKVDFPEEVRV